jgi:hypothetical protein
MPIIPENDPNEACEIGHRPAREHDLPAEWWTVFCNAIPVHHFAPGCRDKAERYATDPADRLGLVTSFVLFRD